MNLAGKAMNGVLLEALSNGFKRKIENIKLEIDPKFPWHPYDTLSNLAYLMPIFNKHWCCRWRSCFFFGESGVPC